MELENDTFLSDWFENKIDDTQFKKLVTTQDFEFYLKLKNDLPLNGISEPNLEANFKKIQEKIETKKRVTKPKVISLWKYTSIAASIVLLLGLYQTFYFSNSIETNLNATKIVTLNDDSKVIMNQKTKLSYPNFFQFNRTLNLDGEAFFEVKKGSTFTVQTPLGSVEVVGTKFNVNNFDTYFEVVCFEGCVKVSKLNQNFLLYKNDKLAFYKNEVEKSKINLKSQPDWIQGETSFKNTPIYYVFKKFELIYNIKFENQDLASNQIFTGSFPNNDINAALKSICNPLQLNYTTRENRIVLSK